MSAWWSSHPWWEGAEEERGSKGKGQWSSWDTGPSWTGKGGYGSAKGYGSKGARKGDANWRSGDQSSWDTGPSWTGKGGYGSAKGYGSKGARKGDANWRSGDHWDAQGGQSWDAEGDYGDWHQRRDWYEHASWDSWKDASGSSGQEHGVHERPPRPVHDTGRARVAHLQGRKDGERQRQEFARRQKDGWEEVQAAAAEGGEEAGQVARPPASVTEEPEVERPQPQSAAPEADLTAVGEGARAPAFAAPVPEDQGHAAHQTLEQYCSGLPRDSFAEAARVNRPSYGPKEVGEGGDTASVVAVTLPLASPVRGAFYPDPAHAVGTSEEKKQREADVAAVRELREAGQLDVQVEAASAPEVGPWPVNCGPKLPLEALQITDLATVVEWPESLILTRVALEPEQAGWNSLAFLSAPRMQEGHPGFGLSLELGAGNPVARLQPVVFAWPVEGGTPQDVVDFHKIMATAAGLLADVHYPCPPLLVLLKEGTETVDGTGIIDWEKMAEVVKSGRPDVKATEVEESSQEGAVLPPWLRLLWRRLTSLQRLQQVAKLAPITPVPNPLRLEAVLGNHFGWGAQAFKALQLWGQTILQLLFSVVHFVENPFDDAGLLSRRVQAALRDERLAALIANSGLLAETLPNVGWEPDVEGIDAETAAATLKALVGAYASEKGGDYYSVVKLWEWLRDREGSDGLNNDELKTAIRYLSCATQTFNGRTPTYEHFSEVDYEGATALMIYYENRGMVYYRRPDVSKGLSHGQELLAYTPGEVWKEVLYDTVRGAFVSPSIQEPDPECQGKWIQSALPNKVSQWIRGRCPAASATLKHYSGNTPVFEALREKKDGSLQVRYQQHGWFEYERCDKGSLGFETQLVAVMTEGRSSFERKGRQPVIYSEKKDEKTLLSPFFANKPLPNKVAEWLLSAKCLSQLVTPKAAMAEEVQIIEHEDHIEWKDQGKNWTCCRKYEKCAIIFVAYKADDDEEAELLFDGQTWATYTHDFQDRYRLPAAAIKWLKQRCMDKGNQLILKAFLKRSARLTWLPVPVQLRSCFPRLPDTDIGHLENSLQHTFLNPMLLAEALTHSSCTQTGLTPDFQRLAYVGVAVAEELVARLLFERVTFSTAATLQNDEAAGANTFAMGLSARVTSDCQWPPVQAVEDPLGAPLSTPDKLRGRWEACCNHVAYARTCVDLQLHQGILMNSAELKQSVLSFVNVVARAKAKRDEDPWPRLLCHDAPRVLGDVFLACMGAVVMDGENGYLHAKEVLRKHVKECETMKLPPAMVPSQSVTERLQPEDMTEDDKWRIFNSSHGTLGKRVCAPKPPPLDAGGAAEPGVAEGDGPGQQSPYQNMPGLPTSITDVHAGLVDGVLIGARSPRTVALRAPYANDDDKVDEGEDIDEERAVDLAAPPGNEETENRAVFCEQCTMWLNGPTQWEDHRIGKKHKKNCKKGSSAKVEAAQGQESEGSSKEAKGSAPGSKGSEVAIPRQSEPSQFEGVSGKGSRDQDTFSVEQALDAPSASSLVWRPPMMPQQYDGAWASWQMNQIAAQHPAHAQAQIWPPQYNMHYSMPPAWGPYH